jgi:PAS domain-containing protein
MNQNLANVLMTRAAAAEKRLMALSHHQESGERTASQLIKSALRELGEVLEELRVATEQLQLASDDIAAARREATLNADRYRELFEGLPLPCVTTTETGCVEQANVRAAKLLNVASAYLSGKPLLLYLPQRDAYFQILEQVKTTGSCVTRALVRPRDRKPIETSLNVSALKQQTRWCWVFGEADGGRESRTAVDGGLLPPDPSVN